MKKFDQFLSAYLGKPVRWGYNNDGFVNIMFPSDKPENGVIDQVEEDFIVIADLSSEGIKMGKHAIPLSRIVFDYV